MEQKRTNNAIKSTALLKAVLFVFLGVFTFTTAHAQCPPTITVTVNNNASAVGVADGDATIQINTPTAGGPFSFYWNFPLGSACDIPTTATTTMNCSSLNSGYNNIYIYDASCGVGTQILDSILITAPGGSIALSTTTVPCGATTIAPIANFTGCASTISNFGNQFVLSDGVGTTILDSILSDSTLTLPALTLGSYSLAVTNLDNGCTDTLTFSITGAPPTFPSTATVMTEVLDVNASPNSDTTSISVSGGSSPYTLTVYDALGGTVFAQSFIGTDTAVTGLGAGTYTYDIVDFCGNSSAGTFTIINLCSATLSMDSTLFSSCDSVIELNANMFNSTAIFSSYYAFELSNNIGAPTDSIPWPFPNFTPNTFSVNASGDYYLMVTDTFTGCVAYDTIRVTLTLLTVNASVMHTSSPGMPLGPCDGSISLTPSGSPNYNYQWYSGFVPPLTSLPQITNSITNLCEDNYCWVVTDAEGCVDSNCVEILLDPCNAMVNVLNPIICNGDTGSLQVTIVPTPTTGAGPSGSGYTCTITDLNGVPMALPQNQPNMMPPFNFFGLPAGIYIAEILDLSWGSSCTDTFDLTEPAPITIYTTVDSSSAPWINDGSINIDSLANATFPITSYTWTDSIGNPFLPINYSTNGNDTLADSLLYSNQYNGGYTISVVDANGCTADTLLYVHPIVNLGSTFVDSTHITHVSCFGDTDGRLFARLYNVPSHSVPPFTFYWKAASDIFHNGAPPTNYTAGDTIRVDSLGSAWYNASHVAIIQNLGAGLVTLDAYDYYGNLVESVDFQIDQPDSVIVTIMDSLPLLDPLNPQFNALGDSLEIDCGYGYNLNSWITGGNSTNDTIFDVYSFSLDFTTPNGWSDTFEITSNYIVEITGTLTYDSLFAVDNIDGLYNYNTLPATDSILWNLNGGVPTNIIAQPNYNAATHTYFVPLDSIVAAGATPVAGNPNLEINEFSVSTTDYNGFLEFKIHKVNLDTFMYNFSWNTVPVTALISDADTAWAYPGVMPTTYVLEVEDVIHQCSNTDTIVVSWDLYTLAFDSVALTDIAPCFGDSTGVISVLADTNFGLPPFTYTYYIDSVVNPNLAPNDTVFTLLPAGTYLIEMVDAYGCVADTTVTLGQPDSMWACGVDTAATELLIESFTIFANNPATYSYTTSPFLMGSEYVIYVTGTYGMDLFTNYKDAAYDFSGAPILSDNWHFDSNPTDGNLVPNQNYVSSHIYEYSFPGDGFTHTIDLNEFNPLPIDTFNNTGFLTFTIHQKICPLSDTAYTCFGDSTGFASAIVVNGGVPFFTGDYEYEWTDVSGTVWGTSASISGLPAGSYTVTVTDSLGCSEYERYLEVIQPATPLQIDSTFQLDVLCKNDTSAVIKVFNSGGFMPHMAVLLRDMGGGLTDTVEVFRGVLDSVVFDSLYASTYYYYLYDSVPDGLYGINMCPQMMQFDIIQPQDSLYSSVNLNLDVKCWGDSTGIATATVIGGQFPYTYLWDNGETTAQADSLWADPNLPFPSTMWHSITFTDANNCVLKDSVAISHTYERIVIDMNLDGIEDALNIIQNVSCYGYCDGIASIASSGGVYPHKYFWDNGHIGNLMPDTAFNLCFGGHNVIIEDALGCRAIDTFNISQPDELFAQAVLVEPITCYGEDDGVAMAVAVGGTTPYSFYWDSIPANPPAFGGVFTTSGVSTPNVLTPGIHIVWVIDAKGCMASDTVFIPEPDSLTVEILNDSTIFPYCLGTTSGQLCSQAYGGTMPYNYTWNDNALQTTSCAYNIEPGIYTVTVFDDRNCVAYAIADIDSVTNTFIPDSVEMTITNVSCFGEDDGAINITYVGGGVPSYDYAWNGPPPYTAAQPSINYLFAGNYSVEITDAMGCKITIYADVLQPDQLEYTTYNVISATCIPDPNPTPLPGSCDGQIWVDVEGGNPPYFYDVDEQGLTYPFANQLQLIDDSLIFDLCTGDHDIYITDASGCQGTVVWGGRWQETVDSGVVVTIDNVTTMPASCFNTFDGTATVINPNTLFTYTWETLAGVVADSIGTSSSILYPGNYNLIAHYADSASFGQIYTACDYTFPFTISSPDEFSSGGAITDVLCYGDANGIINLTPVTVPAGGTLNTPFAYAWDTTASLPLGSSLPVINNLLPGQYSVTITDGIGCIITDSFTVNEPLPITASFDVTPVSCNGAADGIINAIVLPPAVYTYDWSSSATSNPYTGVDIGTHTLIISNTNGCKDTFDVVMTQPDILTVDIQEQSSFGENAAQITYNISCFGANDGAITAISTGGIQPITYNWTDASSTTISTTADATQLSVGQYNIEVTDANGCTVSNSIVLIQPDELMINGVESGDLSFYGYDISCRGEADGAIFAYPSGGYLETNNTYTYMWTGTIGNQLAVLSSVVDVPVGSYDLTITDDNGCTKDTNFVLDEPAEYFDAVINRTDVAAPTHGPVTAMFTDATITTDIINHTWFWTTDDSTVTTNSIGQSFNHKFTEVGAHEVTVYVLNTNSGCIDDSTFVIEVQGIPDIHNVFTPNGDGKNDEFEFGEFGMEALDVSIFNRWGELVHSWTTATTSWDGIGSDGEQVPAGVYYYVLKAEGSDGTYYEKKGSITLIR